MLRNPNFIENLEFFYQNFISVGYARVVFANRLIGFFYKYIARRPYKGPVKDFMLFISYLCGEILCGFVFISTRSLKHLFDKKPAEEFHFILDHIHLILIYPDKIYKNKTEKRGNICLVKKIKGSEYLCSLEKGDTRRYYVVTAFRLRNSDYIKNYTLLWNRGSGKPHRHALEFSKESGDAPQ